MEIGGWFKHWIIGFTLNQVGHWVRFMNGCRSDRFVLVLEWQERVNALPYRKRFNAGNSGTEKSCAGLKSGNVCVREWGACFGHSNDKAPGRAGKIRTDKDDAGTGISGRGGAGKSGKAMTCFAPNPSRSHPLRPVCRNNKQCLINCCVLLYGYALWVHLWIMFCVFSI